MWRQASTPPSMDQLPWLNAAWRLPRELQPLSGHRLHVLGDGCVRHKGLAPWEMAVAWWQFWGVPWEVLLLRVHPGRV